MSITEIRPGTGETAADLAAAEKAKAEAEALRIRNEAERRRMELADSKAQAKAQTDIERDLAKAADERREREEARREAAEAKARAAKSAAQWKRAAKAIAIVCIVVSLPLQIMAFWDPHAWFLVAAPFVLEGVAWALLVGAQAAIDEGRPSWHYRLGALLQALVAAGINFSHGSAEYGIATGIGGALCSLIGPVIWDLHEHGRITKKEDRKTRSQKRAERRAEAAEAALRDSVNAARAKGDPEVWERAVDLATALGEVRPARTGWRRKAGFEVVPSEKTYARACLEIHGAEPGLTAERIAHMRVAKRAVRLAQNGPLETGEKGSEETAKSQVDSQMAPDADESPKAPSKAEKTPGEDGRKRNGGTPPRRVPGTVRYSSAARRQMSVAASRQTA